VPEVRIRSAPWIFTPLFLLAFDHFMLKMGYETSVLFLIGDLAFFLLVQSSKILLIAFGLRDREVIRFSVEGQTIDTKDRMSATDNRGTYIFPLNVKGQSTQ